MSWRASDNEPGPHDVVRIEYDPNRSTHIALIKNQDPSVEGLKKWSYILACEGLQTGHVVESFRQGIPHGLVEGFVDSKKIQGEVLVDDNNAVCECDPCFRPPACGTVKPGNVLTLWLMLTQSSIVSCSTIEFLSAHLAHLDKSLFKRTTEGTLKYVYRAVTCKGLPFSHSHFRAPFRQLVVLHAQEGSHHITYTIHILHFALSTLHHIGFEFVRSM